MADEPMSDAEWAIYRAYADEVAVTVRVVESPDVTDSVEDWFIVSRGAAWDSDWLLREVESIPLGAAARDEKLSPDYYLDFHEHRHSWGADRATVEIVLTIAAWAATSAAWDLTKALAKAMSHRLRGHELATTRPLSEQEAIGRTTWIIEEKYTEHLDSLELHSVQVSAGREATVVFYSSSGWAYECDLVVHDELVILARVRRARR